VSDIESIRDIIGKLPRGYTLAHDKPVTHLELNFTGALLESRRGIYHIQRGQTKVRVHPRDTLAWGFDADAG